MRRRSPSGRLLLIGVVAACIVIVLLGSAGSVGPAATPGPLGAAGANGSAASTASSPATSPPSPAASPSPETSASAAALAASPAASPTAAATPRPTATTTTACAPTDQDRYVYHPARLRVLGTCIRVTGTVAAVRKEADGDLHILLALDAPYRHLLRPSNQGEELGDLVVEPVCVRGVSQADAVAVCAADPDPLRGPFPSVGDHVWMEGRSVLDLEHGSWAELHPLYRWGSS